MPEKTLPIEEKSTLKVCKECGLNKPFEFFHVDNSSKDKRSRRCKSCVNSENKRKTAIKRKDPNRKISCSKCKVKKHISFFTGSPTKSGLYKICCDCRNFQRSILEKQCNTCNLLKPVNKFARSKTAKDGYHNKCKECQKEYYIEYRIKNREVKSEYYKERYILKREEILEKSRIHYQNNREVYLERRRIWSENNKHLVLRDSSIKRARKRNAIPPWLTADHKKQIDLMYLLAKNLEKNTGIKFHVDHIIPLKNDKMCGLHVPWNLRVIPEQENMRKNNKFIPELGLTAC